MEPKRRWDALVRRLPKDRPIVGAEIGIYKGDMSQTLLTILPNLILHMIDRWISYPKNERVNQAGKMIWQSDAQFARWEEMARQKIRPFGERAIVHKGESIQIASKFPPRYFDFVFIDAGHTHSAADADIQAWQAHIKPDGLICGHDYDEKNFPGVVSAVNARFGGKIEKDVSSTWFYRLRPRDYYIRKFRTIFGREADIKRPQTHSEFLMRKMLTEDSDLMRDTADKVKVRDYVRQKIGEKYCYPIIYHGPVPDDIFKVLENIPGGFVIKVNNSAGKNIFILPGGNVGFLNGKTLRKNEIKSQLEIWMKQNWMMEGGLHYYRIKPQIIVEPLISNGVHDVHKIHTWNGKAFCVHSTRYDISKGKLDIHGITWHSLEWRPMDLINRGYRNIEFKRPEFLGEMIEATETLAHPFDHVRVDWSTRGNEFWLSELTHCSGGAEPENIFPLKWQYRFGEEWKRIPNA